MKERITLFYYRDCCRTVHDCDNPIRSDTKETALVGKNKLMVLYILVLIGISRLTGMIFRYTESSLIKITLFVIGISLLIISMFKVKSEPKIYNNHVRL